jgi:hypothetical protein
MTIPGIGQIAAIAIVALAPLLPRSAMERKLAAGAVDGQLAELVEDQEVY